MAKPGSIGGNFQNIIRQAHKMQQKLAEVQEELAEKTYEGAAAAGMVKATVNGNHEVVRIDIDREEADMSDLDLLLDLVAAAVNDGVRRAKEDYEERTGDITGGLKIPGFV